MLMEINMIKIAEFEQILEGIRNNQDKYSEYIRQLLFEAIGILKKPDFKNGRFLNINGVLINYLDEERYRYIIQQINMYLDNINRRGIA